MRVNALLVLWTGGWIEVVDAAAIASGRRIEATLELGTATTAEEALRVATGQLDIYAHEQVEFTVGVEPTSEADTPYLAFAVGDTLDDVGGEGALRVASLQVQTDPVTGRVTFVPQFGAVRRSVQERQQTAVGKTTIGMLGGSPVATPVPAPTPVSAAGVDTTTDEHAWSIKGGVVVSWSTRRYALVPMTLDALVASLDVAGSSTTTVLCRVNGTTTAGTASLTTGSHYDEDAMATHLERGEYYQVGVTAAGTGAEDLGVQVQVTRRR